MTPRIALMIPCLNENKTIGKVISDFRREIPDCEIYVFDNNSSDGSPQQAIIAGATVFYVKEKGKGNVVRKMFRKVDADIYIMVDGDDTYPADNVRDMIRPVLTGQADMVVGDRLSSSYFKENKRRFHNEGNILMKYLVNILFNANLHDVLSGYRVFSRNFVKSISIKSNKFDIETEITAFALQHKFDIMEVVVPYKDREINNPSKLNTIKDGTRIIRTFLRIFRDYRPYLFFSLLAVFITIISVILLIPVFVAYFETGLVKRFPTLIFGCFLLLSALLLYITGLILQVINNNSR